MREDLFYQPLLQSSTAPIRRLTLASANLTDTHLSFINEKHLELIDISQNRISSTAIVAFLERINANAPRQMSLRSVSIAGNSLADLQHREHLDHALCELL